MIAYKADEKFPTGLTRIILSAGVAVDVKDNIVTIADLLKLKAANVATKHKGRYRKIKERPNGTLLNNPKVRKRRQSC